MAGLTERELSLLVAAVRRHDPAAQRLVDKLGQEPLSVDERERLRGAVLAELLAVGLDDHDEHTPLGIELDDIIGALHAYGPDD